MVFSRLVVLNAFLTSNILPGYNPILNQRASVLKESTFVVLVNMGALPACLTHAEGVKKCIIGGHSSPHLTYGLCAQCLPERVQDGRGRG